MILKKIFQKNKFTIKALIFDVDGVLIPNGSYFTEENAQLLIQKEDLNALFESKKRGYYIAFITGSGNKVLKYWLLKQGFDAVYLESFNKLKDFKDFCITYSLNEKECAYAGDSIPDLETLKTCGLPSCPANAEFDVKEVAKFIGKKMGGFGFISELINFHFDASK